MMKRLFTFTLVAGITAGISVTAWSQGGQSGGGGGAAGGSATGGGAGAAGAGAAGTAGTSNAAGAGAAAGDADATATGSPGAGGNQGAAANNNNRAAGNARVGAGVGGNVGDQNAAGANAQGRFNFNGMGQTPFFSDPGARRQLGINDSQFNQLNQAYQRGYQRFNQGQNGANGVGANNPDGQQTRQTGAQPGANAQRFGTRQGSASQQAPQVQEQQQTSQQGTQSGPQGTQPAQQGSQFDQQALQNEQNGDFDSTLNSTFTDPAARQRFNQLNMQYQGAAAFNDPMVQQQLNLDPRQRRNFERMTTEWQRDLASFQRGRQTNLTQQQFNDLRSKFMNRMNRVLTPEQQQQWLQMAGEPYEFPYAAYTTTAPTSNPSSQSVGPQVEQGLQPGESRQPTATSSATGQPSQSQGTVR